jgi:hypothetical protein
MTKFIKGRFYAHDTSEYEFTDNHIEYVYCNDVRNENKGIAEAKPFYVAELITIDGAGCTIECNANGASDTRWYQEISRSVFADKVLEAALNGKDFLTQEIARRRIPRSSAKEEDDELPDYGFGSDEIK